MKIPLLLWVCICVATYTSAQTITVTDLHTGAPIKSASIYSPSSLVKLFTDEEGKADISVLAYQDSIYISHVGYETILYNYDELELNKFQISLLPKHIPLSGVTISNSRWEHQPLETPTRIERINMKEAAFQNPQTTADLLGTSGYAFIQKSQLGGGSPMLRGMATNRVLLVVDGVRMNTAIFRSGNLQNVISLDANAMEGTEIIFGPGSVMYGSDALGGVMNFSTLQPKFANQNKPVLSGNGMMRYSTANTEKTSHLDINLGLKKWAFNSSITYADYGDLRSGSKGGVPYFYRSNYVITIDNKDYMLRNEDSTLQVGSKYSQFNYMGKVRFKPKSNWDLEYAYHFSETSKYNRYDRLYVMQTSGPYKNKLRWAEWYYGPQKWRMHRFGLQHKSGSRFYDAVSLVIAYQFFEESRYDREFMFRELRMQKEKVDAYSINLEFSKKVNDKIKLDYGMESVLNKIHSEATLTHVVTGNVVPTVTRYPDNSTWQSHGAFVNVQYKWNSAWTISAAMRYNFFFIYADFDTSFFPFPFTNADMRSNAPCFSLGTVYSLTKNWQWYANASTGFRAPNIDDMGKVFESVPGYLVVPNPNLKPEYVYNAEIGTVKSFGNRLRLDATGYYTLLTDAMVRRDFTLNGQTTIRYNGNKSIIQAVQNVTQIRVYGVQAGLDFFFKGFGIRSNISYQHGVEQQADSMEYFPLRHAAPTFGSTHFTYELKKFKADVYAVYNARMDYKDLALTERVNTSYARDEKGLPYVASWYTLNFKAAYYPGENLSLSFGLENILDRMYRPYASGINAPGRNLIVSLRARF